MNLQEAKILLENKGYILLKEDADSDGVKKAKQWIETSDALTRTGCSSVEELIEQARREFSHLFWREKGQSRFLPGIIRIAIDDCGWLSGDEDPNDITELKAMYIAATEEFLAYKRNNPGEPFDLNADFNGLSFDGLYKALGSRAINAAKAKLTESKKLLKNKGYKLIREDAYMDAMDQELDDIQRQNNSAPASKSHLTAGNITLTYACKDETMLDACLKKFIDGTANDRAKSALGRLFDLCISGKHIDEIANMKLGDTVTFTEIPVWYGKFPAVTSHVRAYVDHYGEETVKKMIGLACTKRNASELRA